MERWTDTPNILPEHVKIYAPGRKLSKVRLSGGVLLVVTRFWSQFIEPLSAYFYLL